MDGLKTCRRCEVAKAVEEFRAQRGMCRPCERAEKNASRAKLDRAPIVGVPKTCSKCGEEKPCEEFSFDRRASDGRHGWCHPCARTKMKIRYDQDSESARASSRRYKQNNPEATKDAFRDYDIKRRFGISSGIYDALLRRVERCAICKTEEIPTRGWALDHCHETGKLREFLCPQCNTGLGLFKDDPERLIEAAAYLMRHSGALEQLLSNKEE